MAPELPERLLGIDDEDSEDGGRSEEEEFERFLFVAVGEHRLAIPIEDVKTTTEYPDDELTHVPRSPTAVDGVVDLRGEITAVIEPRHHFPAREEPADERSVVVFDRPGDRQPAAIAVDDVLGVETVPKRNVREESEVERRDLAGGALEHPLVAGLVEKERRPSLEIGDVIDTDFGSGAVGGGNEGRSIDGGNEGRSIGGGDEDEPVGAGNDDGNESIADRLRSRSVSTGSFDRPSTAELAALDEETPAGELFVDDTDEVEEEPQPGESEDDRVVVEATALLDVDRLVAASGRFEGRTVG